MPNSLNITIDKDQVSIRSEDETLLVKASSLVALDEHDEIVSVGVGSDEWKNKFGIRLLNPFLLQSFHPKFAAIALDRLAGLALTSVSGPKHQAVSTKPMEWLIDIPGYERLDKNLQELFDYYVQHFSGTRVKSLSINKQRKDVAVFQRIEKIIQLGLVLTVCFMQWLIFRGLQFTMPEEIAKPASALDIFAILAGSMLIFYLSAWLYISACRVILKNLIPIPVYKGMLEDTDLSPKKLWSLLRDRIASRQKGG